MSLIVATVQNEWGHFVADTFITTEQSIISPVSKIENHGLKVHVIENIAIAVAGRFIPGIAAIENFAITFKTSSAPPQEVLLQSWVRIAGEYGISLDETDFLIMIKNPTSLVLFKISNNQITQCQRAYIGDPTAYRDFSSRLAKYKNTVQFEGWPPEYSSYVNNKINDTNAIRDVGISTNHQSVKSFSEFGLCVEHDNNLGFIYPIATTMSTSSEMGRQTHTVLTTTQGKSAVGFYYSGNYTGYLFIAADKNSPHTIQDVTFEQFKQTSKSKFDVDLIGSQIEPIRE